MLWWLVSCFPMFYMIIESWKIQDFKPICIFKENSLHTSWTSISDLRTCRQLKCIRSMVVVVCIPCPIFIDCLYRLETIPIVCRSHGYGMMLVNLQTFVRVCRLITGSFYVDTNNDTVLFYMLAYLCVLLYNYFSCWFVRTNSRKWVTSKYLQNIN